MLRQPQHKLFYCSDTLDDLFTWSRETHHDLPRPAHEIAYIERTGGIIVLDEYADGKVMLDSSALHTGAYFTQADNWTDFAHRWLAEQARCGRPVDKERLAAAIMKANIHHYNYALCRQIAITTLRTLTTVLPFSQNGNSVNDSVDSKEPSA